MSDWRIEHGDCRELLASVPDEAVQCCVTSPPYFGLRDYGMTGQIGLEAEPDLYVAQLVGIFREVRRGLRNDGTLWANFGDSYANDGKWGGHTGGKHVAALHCSPIGRNKRYTGLKPKDLIGIPWRVAFALQADGWYLRSDIIWSKPNPMPESVTDRPTKAHEYVFLLTKSAKYYYDADAIAEPVSVAMMQEMAQGYDGLGLKDYDGAGVQNPSSVKARIIANALRKSDAVSANGRNVQAVNSEAERRDELGTFNNNPRLRPNLTRNKRSVWTISPQPFSGWSKTSRRVYVAWDESDDDTTRITSPDCSVHGDLAVQAAKILCGERVGDLLSRNGRNDVGPAVVPSPDCVPTDLLGVDYSEAESLDSSDLLHGLTATRHSNQSHKTGHALATTPTCTPSVQSLDGIPDISAERGSGEAPQHIDESSIPGRDDQDALVSAQMAADIAGKSSCSCQYYRIVTEKTSHFATMPEELAQTCLLAGSRPGDLVLDPFSGAGTTGLVACRLGRRFLGFDLNADYCELARRRIEDSAPLFLRETPA